MQFFFWLILLIAIGIAAFAVQNSAAPLITMKFLIWKFETSLIYIILGSIGGGVLMTLFFWVPRVIKTSMRAKELQRKIENLETQEQNRASFRQEGNTSKKP